MIAPEKWWIDQSFDNKPSLEFAQLLKFKVKLFSLGEKSNYSQNFQDFSHFGRHWNSFTSVSFEQNCCGGMSLLTPSQGILDHLDDQVWRVSKTERLNEMFCYLKYNWNKPLSQFPPSYPGGHKQRYPLTVKPDWQVALFLHGEFFPQAFWKRETKKVKWRKDARGIELR